MIVLDTHIWYWWINADHDRLTKAQAEALSTASRVGVSAVSCFEMAHAVRRGRIEMSLPMRELNGRLASVDNKFPAYPELAGCLLA